MIGGKKYLNSVILENKKDAMQVAAMEGYGNLGYNATAMVEENVYPLDLIIQKPRNYVTAVIVSLKYSRMGIHNAILKK